MKSIITSLLFLALSNCVFAQEYFNGKFRKKGYTHNLHTYTLYDFSREGGNIKAKYFATNAYIQYQAWKTGKEIILVTAGAFSNGFNPEAIPVGLCVDNGNIVNRSMDNEMDGMVIVYNGGGQQGGIAVVDMDINPVKVEDPIGSGTKVAYYPRTSTVDKTNFLKWGQTNGVTLFQSQLVYSSDRLSNFTNLYYGDSRERRFLAICKKNNVVHHLIVDAPDALALNLSSSYAKAVLEYDGFSVLYIMNLDTGDKNILYTYNGSYLENMRPYKGKFTDRAQIEKATNLLVYYKD